MIHEQDSNQDGDDENSVNHTEDDDDEDIMVQDNHHRNDQDSEESKVDGKNYLVHFNILQYEITSLNALNLGQNGCTEWNQILVDWKQFNGPKEAL